MDTTRNKGKASISKNGRAEPSSEMAGRHAALIELSCEPIFTWDLDAGIAEWNRAAEKLYGFTKAEAIGQSSHLLLKTVHPVSFPKYLDILKTEGFWSGELRHVTKGGESVVVESRQRLVESHGARLVLESNRDITALKLAEDISDRYRVLWDNSSDIIWFVRSDGSFVDVNQAAVDAYGYDRHEFQTMNVVDLRHPSTLSEFQYQLDTAGTRETHFETVHVRRDGTALPVEVRANGADFGGERLVMAIVRDISERKASEDALRESEERRQLAQRAGKVGIFDADLIRKKTFWSETMWTIYGQPVTSNNPDEEFWLGMLHVNDRDRARQRLNDVLVSKDEHFQEEFRIVRSDGTTRWVAVVAKISRDAAGKPLRMYGTNMDVTERKEAEERIRFSENQLRLVTNTVPALISYVDKDERYRFVNEKFTEWIGKEAASFVGMKVRDVLGTKIYRVLKPKIKEALSGRETTFETILDYPKIGRRYVHVSYVPDFGVDGSVHGYYGLTHDLTEVKRSEELLRTSEARMSLFMESITDYAIFALDKLGRVETWNTGAKLIFGYAADEIIGQPFETLFTPEDVALQVPEKEMRIARRKGTASDDRWHLRKDGSRFYANGVMMPLYVGKGLSGYAKIATDLTEKKRSAEELQRAHDELEIRVKERTGELAEINAALLQEMEDREIAERGRADLLSRLVTSQESERRRIARDLHDQLGQRLTALRLKIASLSEVAAGNEIFSSRVRRLQEISERLDSEVSFLAWELRPTALDDLGLVDAVGAFVNEWSRHYEIEADFHSAKDSIDRLDHETETHLYRITQEALNNILKHANAKQVTVLLEKRGEDIILIVEDDGNGFDPTESARSDASKGLGLVGMRERTALIGGDIEIESGAGQGTTIYVRVPAAA